MHPRAREYFTSHEALVDALTNIAKSINKNEDPILVCRHYLDPLVLILECKR